MSEYNNSFNQVGLPLRTKDILSLAGRSDVTGCYRADKYAKTSNTKYHERKKVMDFILPYFDENEYIRLLSMPGRDWMFEEELLMNHRQLHFVGIEKSRTTFLHAQRAIPGDTDFSFACRTEGYGRGDYLYSKRRADKSQDIGQRRSRAICNRLVLMGLSTFTQMLLTDLNASMEQKRKFHNKFYCRNAVWLDFTSGFCREVEAGISNIHRVMTPPRWASSKAINPIVITMMYGRDIPGKESARIKKIKSLQPCYHHVKHWTYRGYNNTPMITMCGEIQESPNMVAR